MSVYQPLSTRFLSVGPLGTALIASLAILLGVGVGACGRADSEGQHPSEHEGRSTVNLGWFPAQHPLNILRERNLLEKAGIDAKVSRFESAAEMFPALRAGSIDVTDMSTIGTVTALAQGIDITVFGVLYDVSRTNGLIVPKGSDLREPSDFAGKRIGAVKASSAYYGLLRWLKDSGMSLSDIEYIEMTPATVIPAFLKGDVDAVYTFAPGSAQLEQRGNVTLTNNLEVGAVQTELWVARTDWLKQNPDAAERLLAAYREAYEVAGAGAKQEKVRGFMETMGLNEPVATIVAERLTWPSLQEMVAEDSRFSLTGGASGIESQLDQTATFMLEGGFIDSKPAIGKAVDPRFVERVRESLGARDGQP